MKELSMFKIYDKKLKIKISLLSIFLIGLFLRFYYFPYELPLIADSLDNFTYAAAINYYGHLPNEWAPANNGWPIFLSFWFSLFRFENTFDYMQLQRIISIILSVSTIIPVYLLCRKFFQEKLALVGAALFVFEPRIILNSTLGITEPLFILLGTSSLIIFLQYERKSIFLSFILASLCTIVRSEGIFLLLALSIMFIIKYKISKEIIKTYIPSLIIFLLILSPIMIYKIDTSGNDGIFQRAIAGTEQIVTITSEGENQKIIAGFELFIKYLGWIMIPSFLLFLPFGLIQYFKKRTKETNFIFIFLLVFSFPLMYAYIRQAQDTRYFYFLYPIFCVISLFAIETYIAKFTKKNIIILFLIVGIFVSSIFFYEYKKIDYEKELELKEIGYVTSHKVVGVNFHPTISQYIRTSEVPMKWPFLFFDNDYKIKIIPTNDYNTIEKFISSSRKNLTHLIIDNESNLPKFLEDVYLNEEKYEYLDKIFDSKNNGLEYNLKIYKINYQIFDLNIDK